MSTPINTVLLAFSIILLSGCDLLASDSDKMSDDELRKSWKDCQYLSNPSKLKILACNNYEKQCEKRKKNGNLACY